MDQKTSKDDLNRDSAEPADEVERKVGQPGDKPYSGILAQPIVLDLKKRDLAASLPVDLEKKCAALFDHFQVEHGNFARLASALASRHVPGFRFQKSAGAPTRNRKCDRALATFGIATSEFGQSFVRGLG